mmetsp:Transcript_18887/g.38459  ORF Transcript_18887/g.38459 Transcript_18887/m.38459 type:complete len:234 (+) Transcript_18887:1122-1823(+)
MPVPPVGPWRPRWPLDPSQALWPLLPWLALNALGAWLLQHVVDVRLEQVLISQQLCHRVRHPRHAVPHAHVLGEVHPQTTSRLEMPNLVRESIGALDESLEPLAVLLLRRQHVRLPDFALVSKPLIYPPPLGVQALLHVFLCVHLVRATTRSMRAGVHDVLVRCLRLREHNPRIHLHRVHGMARSNHIRKSELSRTLELGALTVVSLAPRDWHSSLRADERADEVARHVSSYS